MEDHNLHYRHAMPSEINTDRIKKLVDENPKNYINDQKKFNGQFITDLKNRLLYINYD